MNWSAFCVRLIIRELRIEIVVLIRKYLCKWFVNGESLLIQNDNIGARKSGAIIRE